MKDSEPDGNNADLPTFVTALLLWWSSFWRTAIVLIPMTIVRMVTLESVESDKQSGAMLHFAELSFVVCLLTWWWFLCSMVKRGRIRMAN